MPHMHLGDPSPNPHTDKAQLPSSLPFTTHRATAAGTRPISASSSREESHSWEQHISLGASWPLGGKKKKKNRLKNISQELCARSAVFYYWMSWSIRQIPIKDVTSATIFPVQTQPAHIIQFLEILRHAAWEGFWGLLSRFSAIQTKSEAHKALISAAL